MTTPITPEIAVMLKQVWKKSSSGIIVKDQAIELAAAYIAQAKVVQELVHALKLHHEWQTECSFVVVPDKDGGNEIIDCEYYESTLRHTTLKALKKAGAL